MALETLANSRSQRGRDPQTLTVIDPEVRIRSGLPILDISSEMQYYGIEDPYGKSNLYYKDHFVCLWQVTAEEVVGSWEWDDLRTDLNWYENIIMPAFRRFKQQINHESSAFDFSGMLECLRRKCFPLLARLFSTEQIQHTVGILIRILETTQIRKTTNTGMSETSLIQTPMMK